MGSVERACRCALIAIVCALSLPGCDVLFSPSYDWAYKLEFILDTPEGPKSASSVISIHAYPTSGRAFYYGYKSHGEAPHLMLHSQVTGKPQYLIALLTSQPNGDAGYFYSAWNAELLAKLKSENPDWIGGASGWHFLPYLDAVPYGVPRPLPKERWPLFVTFRDPADPSSIKVVGKGNLSQEFGFGGKVKNVTVERTRDNVPWPTIQKKMPWLAESLLDRNSVKGIGVPPYYKTDKGLYRRVKDGAFFKGPTSLWDSLF